jgi:hypothetical protein
MSIAASLVGPVTGLLDKFIEDKDQKARLSHEIATLAEKQSHEALKGSLKSTRWRQLTRVCSLPGGDRP